MRLTSIEPAGSARVQMSRAQGPEEPQTPEPTVLNDDPKASLLHPETLVPTTLERKAATGQLILVPQRLRFSQETGGIAVPPVKKGTAV